MNNRINDIRLGATVVVGLLTLYVAWNVFKGYKGTVSE